MRCRRQAGDDHCGRPSRGLGDSVASPITARTVNAAPAPKVAAGP
jgi:hypothetical protein